MNTNRREFLRSVAQTATVLSIGSQVPIFWTQAAAAQESSSAETVLVVLQLSGGNDGLNTIIPFRDEAYRKARPKLGSPTDDVLKINDELGFHPSARGMANCLARPAEPARASPLRRLALPPCGERLLRGSS